MKKEYTKPEMQVIKIQQQHVICTSPGGYSGKTLGIPSGDPVSDEDDII